MPVHRFRALTSDVEVACGDGEVDEVVSAIIATYPPARAEPTLRYRIDQGGRHVLRGDHVVRECEHPLDAPSAFEFDLYQQVVAAAADGVAIHAAAVVLDGRAIVLAGPSGSGKTTLTLRLLAIGADYMTEECTLIRADRTVLGLPRPITRLPDEDSPPPPGLTARQIRRRLEGRIVRRTLLLPPPGRIHTLSAPISCIIGLERDGERKTEWSRLGGVDALSLLQASSMNAGAGALQAAIGAAGVVTVHRLRSRTVDEAIAAIGTLRTSGPF